VSSEMAIPSEVRTYLKGLPKKSRGLVASLRETIRSAAPDAIETISYRMPAFKEGGRMLVWYAGFRDHCSMFPATDGVRAALGEELSPYLSGKGTIRFPLDEPLPVALVRRIVKARRSEIGPSGGRGC
jgi:uncharacterized protein YdhG (YjbR/CyaY superfamily)